MKKILIFSIFIIFYQNTKAQTIKLYKPFKMDTNLFNPLLPKNSNTYLQNNIFSITSSMSQKGKEIILPVDNILCFIPNTNIVTKIPTFLPVENINNTSSNMPNALKVEKVF